MADDVWDHPDTRTWMDDVRENMLPKLRSSAISMAIIGDSDPDIKQAVEIGYTLLLGKPLVLLVTHGTPVPEGLAAAALSIIELDLEAPDARQRVAREVDRLLRELGKK